MAQTAKKVQKIQLKPETLQAFAAYVREAEAAMQPALNGSEAFLWSDALPERVRELRKGEILAQFWSGQGPIRVPNGLIHDWTGAVLIPGATVKQTVRMVQDYNNHKNIYQPEVMDSKLLSNKGNDFQIYLRLLKKKIITVVLDTYHDVHYGSLNPTAWFLRSYTTRIHEVEDPGTPQETILPPDTGYGFIWRLYTYWKFQEQEESVVVECRAMSLSRNVPLGLGWLIEPIIQKLPRESLIQTLAATRHALMPTP